MESKAKAEVNKDKPFLFSLLSSFIAFWNHVN